MNQQAEDEQTSTKQLTTSPVVFVDPSAPSRFKRPAALTFDAVNFDAMAMEVKSIVSCPDASGWSCVDQTGRCV